MSPRMKQHFWILFNVEIKLKRAPRKFKEITKILTLKEKGNQIIHLLKTVIESFRYEVVKLRKDLLETVNLRSLLVSIY